MIKKSLREEVKKHRTYYKTFHRGFKKGMTEGDIRERLGNIKCEIQKWPIDIPIFTRDLKEMLGQCGYYLTGNQICKLVREGFLHGEKIYNRFWYYSRRDLYNWVVYLEEVGLNYLIGKGVIKEEKEEDLSRLIRPGAKPNRKLGSKVRLNAGVIT